MTNSIFGVSETALKLCEDRAVLLSSNIVNGSTPNYQARDIDYQKLVREAASNATSNGSAAGGIKESDIQYRVPMQKSMDGNTVDEEIERKNFIENAIHYQVNLTFIQNKSDELMKAIKGD